MNRLSALIFPDTVPDEQVLFSLVPVFQPLVYTQPVERETSRESEFSPLCRELSRHGLCRCVFPAPLGADRERFMRLLSDLRHRGDDYAAQLSHVSLASLGARGREQESKSSILSSLLNRHGIKNDRPDRRTMALWQARLILKLAEFHDEDQRELQRELARISEREKGLIAELRKENGRSFSPTGALFAAPPENSGLQRLRLKAWTRMFALGEASPDDVRVFVTRDHDAFDRIAEEYENARGGRPEEVFRLPLPRSGESAGYPEHLQKMSADGEGIFAAVNGLLLESAGVENIREISRGYEELLEKHFPAAGHGRRDLRLYRFPRVSARRLLLESFGHDDDLELMPAGDPGEADIVIGVLGGG